MKLFDAVEQFNTNFWDCNCINSYIKSIDIQSCSVCGAEQDEQPSSLKVEVDKYIASGLAKPSHYARGGGVEPIDLILAQKMCFLQGNLIKYSARFPHKGTPIEDLEKIIDYAKRLINEYKSGRREV